MKRQSLMMVVFGVGCLAAGGTLGIAQESLASRPRDVRCGPAAASPSYAQRQQAARDLESFEGGRQVIIATEYDVHILVGLVIVAAIIVIILLA